MLLDANLPDDPDALRAIIAEQADERRGLEERIVALVTANEDDDAEIARLNAIITAFQRHRFGARSEKLDDDQLELALEELDAALSRVRAGLEAASARAGTARPRRANRGSLPAHLERVEQVIDVGIKSCACCGGDLHLIGEDVAERLDVVPTTFRVLVTRRPRCGCRACEDAPVQAPAPPHIVDAGLPDRGADRACAGRQVC